MKCVVIIALWVFICTSCSEDLIHEEFQNNPIGNYDAIWSECNRNYGAFEAKHINWDSLYSVYRAGLTNQSSNTELYNAVTGLISNLNDGHITLLAPGYKVFYSCKNNLRPHFIDSNNYEKTDDIAQFFKIITENYVQVTAIGKPYITGVIKNWYTYKKIGYLYISTFADGLYPESAVNDAMSQFEGKDAIILDLRFNGGGATDPFLHLLSKFADREHFYLQSKLRNGLKKTDFTKVYRHTFGPRGNAFKPKPVILLVNKFTASSSEHVYLALKTLPYVTVVGDTTTGALSTVEDKLMPNGWQFRVTPQVLLDTLGNYLADSKGRYPDGWGFAPDVWVINTLHNLNLGRDDVLSKAIEIITLR